LTGRVPVVVFAVAAYPELGWVAFVAAERGAAEEAVVPIMNSSPRAVVE
jgi:hypothetical protein